MAAGSIGRGAAAAVAVPSEENALLFIATRLLPVFSSKTALSATVVIGGVGEVA